MTCCRCAGRRRPGAHHRRHPDAVVVQAGTASAVRCRLVLGIVVVIVVVLAIRLAPTSVARPASRPRPPPGLPCARCAAVIGVRQWRRRPRGDESVSLPKWMAAIDDVTPVKAVGLGFLLSAVNPKNLLMRIAAGASRLPVAGSTPDKRSLPGGLLRRHRGLHRRRSCPRLCAGQGADGPPARRASRSGCSRTTQRSWPCWSW